MHEHDINRQRSQPIGLWAPISVGELRACDLWAREADPVSLFHMGLRELALLRHRLSRG